MEEIVVKKPKSFWKKLFEGTVDFVAFAVFIFGVFLFLKVFVISPVVVKGHSMLPNYKPGEYIFVDEFLRKLRGGIKRGDVVVVMPPSSNVSFLKRVVGLPGETIELKSGSVFVCKTAKQWEVYTGNDIDSKIAYNDGKLVCKKLIEPYIQGKTVNLYGYPEKIVTTAKCGISKFVLGTGQYLVFGDDRMYSTDSRCCFRGFCNGTGDTYYITKQEILGKVLPLKFGW